MGERAPRYVWFQGNDALSMYVHSYETFEEAWDSAAEGINDQISTWGLKIKMVAKSASICKQQPERFDSWVVATYEKKGCQQYIRIIKLG